MAEPCNLAGQRPPGVYVHHGDEMMRVQGVFMYMINKEGEVGAFLGHKTLRIITYWSTKDSHPVRAVLKLDRFVYPLAGCFSPIFLWGSGKLAIPSPHTSLQDTYFIIARLPVGMSEYQRSTLCNLLQVNAHLLNVFQPFKADPTEEPLIGRSHTSFSDKELERLAAEPAKATSVFVLTTFDELFKLEFSHPLEVRLVVRFLKIYGTMHEQDRYLRLNDWTSVCHCLTEDYRHLHTEPHARKVYSTVVELLYGASSETEDSESSEFRDLGPPERREIKLSYMYPPSNNEHVFVSCNPMAVTIRFILIHAIEGTYAKMVARRREQELCGAPPCMRTNCLTQPDSEHQATTGKISMQARSLRASTLVDMQKAHGERARSFVSSIPDLESASTLFDSALKLGVFHLVEYEGPPPELNTADLTILPYRVVTRYSNPPRLFGVFHGLCMSVDDYLNYERCTRNAYQHRVAEECQHNYPKRRPINPYLDPKSITPTRAQLTQERPDDHL